MNEILSWLSLPEGERPSFIAVHFEEPGKTGHSIGPSNTDGVSLYSWILEPRPRGYTFFMLNSAEHELFSAHKC